MMQSECWSNSSHSFDKNHQEKHEDKYSHDQENSD